MRKCAILLSGGVNHIYNHERYKNDLYLAYSVLKNIGNFSDEDIFLFYGNGTGNFKDSEIIPQAAKKDSVLRCLVDIKLKLDENDEFVLVVSNHGGDEENGNICLWGYDDSISLSELSVYLNGIKAKKIIILGECFAGNILKYNITNSCIFTANEEGKPSYASLQNDYDEFLYHFFSYVLSKYPDTGIRIPEGKNNLIEAYQYARKHDAYCPDNKRRKKIIIGKNEITEIPQMKNNLMEKVVKF